MSDDNERELTEAEQTEVMRRVMSGLGPEGFTEKRFNAAMEELTQMGLAEKDPEGEGYRITEAGAAQAAEVMKMVLNEKPPRADAEMHLWSALVDSKDDDTPETALAASFEFGKQVIEFEHHRLATEIEALDEPWAEELAEVIRQGLM